jgi:hypothetical protein
MALSYFSPHDRELDWYQLDEISKKQEDKYTWPYHTLMYLKSNGFEVVELDMFDYRRFSSEGEAYLIEYYGNSVGRNQSDNSDIPFEQAAAEQYSTLGINRQEVPTRKDLELYLEQGYIVLCFVNSGVFTGSRRPVGHYVLVSNISDEFVTLQDPGLYKVPGEKRRRGKENRQVIWKTFERAWNFSGSGTFNLIAIRK